jgi:hypothetical protein
MDFCRQSINTDQGAREQLAAAIVLVLSSVYEVVFIMLLAWGTWPAMRLAI